MLEAVGGQGFDPVSQDSSNTAEALIKSFLSGRLYYTRDSNQVKARFPVGEATLRDLLTQQLPRETLERLAKEGFDQHKFLMALLLSVTPIDQMSLDTKLALDVKTVPGSKARILPFHEKNWGLCDLSESYLEWSMDEESAVLMGGSLLVKSDGRLAGLCVSTASTETGTFLKGGWYQPVDEATILTARSAIRTGAKSAVLGDGDWVYMRDVTAYRYGSVSGVLEKAISYASSATTN
jgi:hypothetical protein